MNNPIVKIIDLKTNEEIERSMTAAEYKQFKEDQEAAEAKKTQSQAKQAARQSALEKLAALGLTEAEIAALAG